MGWVLAMFLFDARSMPAAFTPHIGFFSFPGVLAPQQWHLCSGTFVSPSAPSVRVGSWGAGVLPRETVPHPPTHEEFIVQAAPASGKNCSTQNGFAESFH